MTFTAWDNPMGTGGFEFVEYAAPDPGAMREVFERLGFTAIARHRHKTVTLYRQGEINFILNAEPDSFAQRFARMHGPDSGGAGSHAGGLCFRRTEVHQVRATFTARSKATQAVDSNVYVTI